MENNIKKERITVKHLIIFAAILVGFIWVVYSFIIIKVDNIFLKFLYIILPLLLTIVVIIGIYYNFIDKK